MNLNVRNNIRECAPFTKFGNILWYTVGWTPSRTYQTVLRTCFLSSTCSCAFLQWSWNVFLSAANNDPPRSVGWARPNKLSVSFRQPSFSRRALVGAFLFFHRRLSEYLSRNVGTFAEMAAQWHDISKEPRCRRAPTCISRSQLGKRRFISGNCGIYDS